MESKEKASKVVLAHLKSKEMESVVREHIASQIPLRENMFVLGSDSYSDFFKEARRLYEAGEIQVDDTDKIFMEKLATGQRGVFQGNSVALDSPSRISGGNKKFRVFVNSGKKDKEGRIIAKKIEWGDPNLKIRNDDPEAAKSFRARHQCSTKTDKKTPGWWACNVHLFAKQLGLKSTRPW